MSVESFGLRFFLYFVNPKVFVGWAEATVAFGGGEERGGEVENIQ